MKKFSKLFISLLAAGSLASCSSDNFDGPVTPQPGEADGVHMKLTISLPVSGGTRAAGDPVGEEVGQTWENTVNEVLIVLADKDDNSFISSASNVTVTPESQSGKYTAEATFNASVLINYIESLSSHPEQVGVRAYAFCNPKQELKDVIASRSRGDNKSLWIDEVYELSNENLNLTSVKDAANIPMANSKAREENGLLKLPKKKDILDGKYAETPYEMGNIEVMRSIARFDYKTVNEGEMYPISVNLIGTDGNSTTVENGLQIQLTHMALVNMSKSFYYLHRTGDKVATASSIIYCGNDSRDSYIVDSDWTWKNKGNWTTKKKYSDNFFYPLFSDATSEDDGELNISSWNAIEISKLGNQEDSDDSWNKDTETEKKHDIENDGYRIWRYVTENTIPGEPVNQKNAISTGIVFRGIIKATDKTPAALKDALENEKHAPIFVYKDGTVYENWEAVEKAATKDAQKETAFGAAYKACENKEGEELYKEAVKQRFTIYRYDEDAKGYATLYYYWNRHWDNGKPGVMAPMEFAVVRNNVYKLSVLDISGLGHPRNPGDDPDPVDPNDPDESADVKIKLSVSIKNWTVRKNGIHL